MLFALSGTDTINSGSVELDGTELSKLSENKLADIRRALMSAPEILFADEPTGALNSKSVEEIMELLSVINGSGTAILLVTHDTKVAARADRVLFMKDGAIKSELSSGDNAQEVLNSWESDPDVAKYMFWTSHSDINKTIEWLASEIEKINSDDWFRWAFVSKELGELLGTGLIYVADEYKKFEIGYNLGKHAWGYGYTTEAMIEVIRFVKDIPYECNAGTKIYEGKEYVLKL